MSHRLISRLARLRYTRPRKVQDMTDEELHQAILDNIEAEGGAKAVAGRHRVGGNEAQAKFVELYVAGDPSAWDYFDQEALL